MIMSASETAFFSLSSFTIKSYKNAKDKKKKLISKVLTNPRELLVTILMLNIFCNILVQNTVSNIFGSFSSWLIKVGVPLALTLFVGEVIPKSLALPNNTTISKLFVRFIYFMEIILSPLRKPLTKLTSYISRFIFFFLKKERPLSTDELEHIVNTSKEKGILTSDEAELVSGYLDLKEAVVKERMRPRDEILFYDIEDNIETLIDLFVEKECSRVPVCNRDLDKLLGIISSQKFFLHQDKIVDSSSLEKYVKKPYFVFESTKAWNLLCQLRIKDESIAMVVDEYGSISGLITQEDLIESIVGEIEDERDVKDLYTHAGKDAIIASGKLTLEEFEDIFNYELPSHSKVVTLGGWLIEKLGDIPQAGTRYVYKNYLFYVLATEPNKVKRIYVRLMKAPKKRRKND